MKWHPLISGVAVIAALSLGCATHCNADVVDRFGKLPRFFYDFTEPVREWGSVDFDSAAYLSEAIELQSLGEKQTVALLRELAKRKDGSKIVPLCRMLFVARKDRVFRAPAFGMPNNCPRSDGSYDWPLEPIAIVDGVPFLITNGYTIAGKPESGAQYLEYCVSECAWNPERFGMPSAQGLHEAYERLRGYTHFDAVVGKVWFPFFKSQIERPNSPQPQRSLPPGPPGP